MIFHLLFLLLLFFAIHLRASGRYGGNLFEHLYGQLCCVMVGKQGIQSRDVDSNLIIIDQ